MPNDAVVFSRGLATTMPSSYVVGAIPAYSNCYALCLFKVTASSLLFLGSLTCIDDGALP